MMYSGSAARSLPDFARSAAKKVVRRYRRDGFRQASNYYATSAKHLAHYLAYDRWLDRLERRRSSGACQVSGEEVVGPVGRDDIFYQAFPRLPLFWAIDALGIDPRQFSFVDYGSGRGRQLLAAATLPFRRVVGVEFASSLHSAAVENISGYPPDRIAADDLSAIHANAIDFDLPDGNLVIFIFNSFQGETLERVADRIEDTFRDAPRTIYLIYGNSHRLPAFRRRSMFRQIRPPFAQGLKLSVLGTVAVDLYAVGKDTGDLPERERSVLRFAPFVAGGA